MNNDITEKTSTAVEHEHGHDVNEKMGYDKSGAMAAENIEHEMTVMQAVKAYPAASWWAFVMSSTIVSFSLNVSKSSSNTTTRSWNHTVSS